MQKNINRRGFLQNSTLISAGLFFASAGFSSFTGEGNKTSNHPENSYSNKKKRKIGSLEVSAIGLGCMSMAGIYNAPQDKGEMVKVIRQAYENGVDFFDTAEVYGPFFSEEIVGEAIAPFRKKINIASKFGFSYNGNNVTGKNSSPQHIRSAVEGMLKRLRIETIDLLYLHRMDTNVPIEDIAGTVKELIKEGKARNFGVSEVSPETIRKAHAVQPVAALQSEYQSRSVKTHIASLGTVMESWFPLGGRGTGISTLSRNEVVTSLASTHSKTPYQVLLRWQLQAGNIAIPGSGNAAHIQEDFDVFDFELSAAEMQRLNALDRQQRFASY